MYVSNTEIEAAAAFIADLVEEGAWQHMSEPDSQKAIAKIRELVRKAEKPTLPRPRRW
jgi:type I site-specific restriction endonuclease